MQKQKGFFLGNFLEKKEKKNFFLLNQAKEEFLHNIVCIRGLIWIAIERLVLM